MRVRRTHPLVLADQSGLVTGSALWLEPPLEGRLRQDPLPSLFPAEHMGRAGHGIDAGYVVGDGVDALLVLLDVPVCFVAKAPVLDPVPVGAEVEAVLLPPFRDTSALMSWG